MLKNKSFDFAIRVVNLSKYLREKHREIVISKQILWAGTAIGAMLREAEFAENTPDFLHKLNIGLKEANETIYWLELLFATGYINKRMYDSMHEDASAILKMVVKSIKTIKHNRVSIP